MKSNVMKSTGKEKVNLIKSQNKFINVKSNYFIQKVFDIIHKRISLEIIKYNINIQKRLNININNYKEFCENFSSIDLEIIPNQNKYGYFIILSDFFLNKLLNNFRKKKSLFKFLNISFDSTLFNSVFSLLISLKGFIFIICKY